MMSALEANSDVAEPELEQDAQKLLAHLSATVSEVVAA